MITAVAAKAADRPLNLWANDTLITLPFLVRFELCRKTDVRVPARRAIVEITASSVGVEFNAPTRPTVQRDSDFARASRGRSQLRRGGGDSTLGRPRSSRERPLRPQLRHCPRQGEGDDRARSRDRQGNPRRRGAQLLAPFEATALISRIEFGLDETANLVGCGHGSSGSCDCDTRKHPARGVRHSGPVQQQRSDCSTV